MKVSLDDQLERLNKNLGNIQKTIGYEFKNTKLLIQAFTKDTFKTEYNKTHEDKIEDNKLLTYVGCKFYDLAVTLTELDMHGTINDMGEYVSSYTEKIMDQRNQKINNECKNSDAIAISFLFTSMLIGSEESNEVRVIPKVMADLYEAIIGAVAIDSEFDIKKVRVVAEKMSKIESKLALLDTIYKNLKGDEMMLI